MYRCALSVSPNVNRPVPGVDGPSAAVSVAVSLVVCLSARSDRPVAAGNSASAGCSAALRLAMADGGGDCVELWRVLALVESARREPRCRMR